MLVYSKDGEPHLLCYLLDRFPVNAAQHEGTTALRGQRVENGLEVTQLVTSMQCFLSPVVRLQDIQFSYELQRYDLFPPGLINQQIACDLEEKRLATLRATNVAIGIGSGHALGDQIVDIMTARHYPTQP